jgi:hypothetical protein
MDGVRIFELASRCPAEPSSSSPKSWSRLEDLRQELHRQLPRESVLVSGHSSRGSREGHDPEASSDRGGQAVGAERNHRVSTSALNGPPRSACTLLLHGRERRPDGFVLRRRPGRYLARGVRGRLPALTGALLVIQTKRNARIGLQRPSRPLFLALQNPFRDTAFSAPDWCASSRSQPCHRASRGRDARRRPPDSRRSPPRR